MELSSTTKLYSGIVILSIVTIESGGLFLLSILKGQQDLTPFQQAMFRAGHAHAGVLTMLCILAQLLIGAVSQEPAYVLRSGFVAAALLMAGGFFAAAGHHHAIAPNKWIGLLYTGAGVLAVSLVWLGILLIRSATR
jgi:hypothetical protein